MLKTLAAVTLLGVACALPQSGINFEAHGSINVPHAPRSLDSRASGGQKPFAFPLPNGFPDVDKNTLLQIEKAAHGTLPNSPGPTKLGKTSAIMLELVAFNELFEVAFFTSLIANITNNVQGFAINSPGMKTFVLNALTAVQAQEQLHALAVNGILTGAGHTAVKPCNYVFPTTDFDSAIRFASTFTDVVLGVLQNAEAAFAADADAALLVPLVASGIGQEGEQNGTYAKLSAMALEGSIDQSNEIRGWTGRGAALVKQASTPGVPFNVGSNKTPTGYYRSLLQLIPSSQPFLSRAAGLFAYSALNQLVIVPGSCSNSKEVLPIPILGALTVTTKDIQLKDQTLSFSVDSNANNPQSWSVVFVNGQNTPVVVPVSNVKITAGRITFSAQFKAATLVAYGLTIAVVTKTKGPFADVQAVEGDALFGPGLIEIL